MDLPAKIMQENICQIALEILKSRKNIGEMEYKDIISELGAIIRSLQEVFPR